MRARPLILVVDDDEDFLEIFSVKLTAAGFDAVIAKTGKEAMQKTGEVIPDLILMDIHMPHESGTDIALEIKQNPALAHIKIAFLTNLKEPWPAVAGDKVRIAKELGMEDFLEKGEDLDALVLKVREVLRGVPEPESQAAAPQERIPPEVVPSEETSPTEIPGENPPPPSG